MPTTGSSWACRCTTSTTPRCRAASRWPATTCGSAPTPLCWHAHAAASTSATVVFHSATCRPVCWAATPGSTVGCVWWPRPATRAPWSLPCRCVPRACSRPKACARPENWVLFRAWVTTPAVRLPIPPRWACAVACPRCSSPAACKGWHWTCPRPCARPPTPACRCASRRLSHPSPWWQRGPPVCVTSSRSGSDRWHHWPMCGMSRGRSHGCCVGRSRSG